MTHGPILSVEKVSMRYPIKRGPLGKVVGYVNALDDVSIDLAEGEVLGLLGESGSGKTTLGRIVLRLMAPSSGDVTYKGESIVGLKDRELRQYRREAQMVFQDPYSALNPEMTIADIVTEPIRLQRRLSAEERRQVAAELLKDVSLDSEYLDRYPPELSGGQRQRVVIARALALRPSLIVADEPVASLDVSIQAQILVLLQNLRKERNLSMLFISHDIAVVRHISDRIAVMYAGRIVEIGSSAQMIDAPVHPYTEMLVASEKNIFELSSKDGTAPTLTSEAMERGCVFAGRCPHVASICLSERPVLKEDGLGRTHACIRRHEEIRQPAPPRLAVVSSG